jgi:hypothetical protein
MYLVLKINAVMIAHNKFHLLITAFRFYTFIRELQDIKTGAKPIGYTPVIVLFYSGVFLFLFFQLFKELIAGKCLSKQRENFRLSVILLFL